MVAAVCLSLFAALTLGVQAGWTQPLDTHLMLTAGGARPAWATPIMQAMSVIGSGAVEIPLALLLSLRLAMVRRRSEAAGYASAALSGWAIYGVLKFAFQRARPKVIPRLMHGAGWFSYPSGHSTLAPLVFGLGALIWSARWPVRTRALTLVTAAVLALLIGYSRVYVGVHWPSDVVAGLLLGTGWSAMWVWWWERAGERGGVAPEGIAR